MQIERIIQQTVIVLAEIRLSTWNLSHVCVIPVKIPQEKINERRKT